MSMNIDEVGDVEEILSLSKKLSQPSALAQQQRSRASMADARLKSANRGKIIVNQQLIRSDEHEHDHH